MSHVTKLIGAGLAAFAIVAFGALSTARPAFAADTYNYRIDPICSDPSSDQSLFILSNAEDRAQTIAYYNNDTNTGGSVTIAANTSANVQTDYAEGANNRVTFTAEDGSVKNTNVNTAGCVLSANPTTGNPGMGGGTGTSTDPTTGAPTTGSGSTTTDPTPATCTDASDASQLDVKWLSDSTITITTKNGTPICDTVDIYYSTYRMPDTYVGQGEFNSTAYPQTLDRSIHLTLWKGSLGLRLVNVPAPDYCQNTQADLYYAPEIVGINGDGYGYHADGSTIANGHGTQNIASQVFLRDASKCAPGKGAGTSTTTGGNGTGTMTTSTPAVLPDTTGPDRTNLLIAAVAAMTVGAGSLGILGYRTLRKNR